MNMKNQFRIIKTAPNRKIKAEVCNSIESVRRSRLATTAVVIKHACKSGRCVCGKYAKVVSHTHIRFASFPQYFPRFAGVCMWHIRVKFVCVCMQLSGSTPAGSIVRRGDGATPGYW